MKFCPIFGKKGRIFGENCPKKRQISSIFRPFSVVRNTVSFLIATTYLHSPTVSQVRRWGVPGPVRQSLGDSPQKCIGGTYLRALESLVGVFTGLQNGWHGVSSQLSPGIQRVSALLRSGNGYLPSRRIPCGEQSARRRLRFALFPDSIVLREGLILGKTAVGLSATLCVLKQAKLPNGNLMFYSKSCRRKLQPSGRHHGVSNCLLFRYRLVGGDSGTNCDIHARRF
jgi:hypothetical protein